ncbi:uncharacterized protein LOC123813669 [Phyllostomus hastatus]|uniref:uncharacterized protein LOC123813669 n=1 Tax=Phyllostomus hastatus TaxID=9423 RepID=UPI001E680AB3|nr:uncharacterized protein LOC123813669 [Phyllostomus hastatus]
MAATRRNPRRVPESRGLRGTPPRLGSGRSRSGRQREGLPLSFSGAFARRLGSTDTVRGVSASMFWGLCPGERGRCPEEVAGGPAASHWQVREEGPQLQQVEGTGDQEAACFVTGARQLLAGASFLRLAVRAHQPVPTGDTFSSPLRKRRGHGSLRKAEREDTASGPDCAPSLPPPSPHRGCGPGGSVAGPPSSLRGQEAPPDCLSAGGASVSETPLGRAAAQVPPGGPSKRLRSGFAPGAPAELVFACFLSRVTQRCFGRPASWEVFPPQGLRGPQSSRETRAGSRGAWGAEQSAAPPLAARPPARPRPRAHRPRVSRTAAGSHLRTDDFGCLGACGCGEYRESWKLKLRNCVKRWQHHGGNCSICSWVFGTRPKAAPICCENRPVSVGPGLGSQEEEEECPELPLVRESLVEGGTNCAAGSPGPFSAAL